MSKLERFSRNADVHLQDNRVYESGRHYMKEMAVIQS